MYIKSLGFAIALAITLLPSNSFAQSRTGVSIEDINSSALPNGSIVIIRSEESQIPGYVHTQYAFIDRNCGPLLVDRYSAPVNPNDKELQRAEQRLCTEIANNDRGSE